MGIQIFNGLNNYSYGNYHREIPQVNPEELKAQENLKNGNVKPQEDNSVATAGAVDNRSRTSNLENISLTFNKEDDFGHIGLDAPISKLDMKEVISDMKKDTILQEYNYFVGPSKNLYTDADGTVVLK